MSIRSIFLAAAAFLPAFGALAQFDPAWSWNRHDWFVTTTGAITTTRGYEFTVSAPVNVTAIGVFDTETAFGSAATARSFPGLAQAHPVALWNLANTTAPLATGTVQAGQATPLCRDGYRYAPIPSSTLLTPGNTYVVSAFWPQDDGTGNFDPYPDLQSSNAPITFDPRVTLGQARHLLGGGPNQFPSSPGGQTNGYIGLLNFRIGFGSCEFNPPAGLATTFQGGNGQAGNMFDLAAQTAQGLTITGFQINLNDEVTNQSSVAVSVYTREGSFIGHESSPAGWTLHATVHVRSWGANQPTPVNIPWFTIPDGGVTGVFITTDFVTGQPPPASPPFLNYSNIPPASPTYGNTQLLITGGVGKANPRFTGATFANKMWNGGVLYVVGITCYPDCNFDRSLNVMDFICFQSSFAAQMSYADCDRSNTWNVNDFVCYLAAFAAAGPGSCP